MSGTEINSEWIFTGADRGRFQSSLVEFLFRFGWFGKAFYYSICK